MKKILLLAVLTATITSAIAGNYPALDIWRANGCATNKAAIAEFFPTLEAKTNLLNEVIAKNAAETPAGKTWKWRQHGLMDVLVFREVLKVADATLLADLDQKLADSRFIMSVYSQYIGKLPKCWAFAQTQPWGQEMVAKRRVYVREYLKGGELSVPAQINILAEDGSLGYVSKNSISNQIKNLSSQAVKAIKRKIRENGGTFVVGEDGVNPVQDAVDALTNALQAPKCAGLAQWVATYYSDYQWIEPLWVTDEVFNKFKDDVLYGALDLTTSNSCKLLFYLGLDEYNNFIKVYNGTND